MPETAGRVAIIGRAATVAAFRGAGMEVAGLDDNEDAAARCQALLDSGCQVVFYTEDIAGRLAALVERNRTRPLPCLAALPVGDSRAASERLKDIVRRAVGADVYAGRHPPSAVSQPGGS
ncbi:hypothetical protein FJY71_00520 [candidate division WOR-3 bacterium]|nr:hypothetical protein [candidate division WOR-3 bacterium]